MKQKIQFLIVSMLFLLATPAALTAYGQPVLTFAAQNGTITAKAGGATITSGATVAQGTTLTFTITPSQGYTLSSLTTQQFIFGEDFQVNNRSVGIDTGTDVTASATYSASTDTYSYTCTMPANNFDVRAVFTPVLATGVTLNKTSVTLTSAGETAALTATVVPSNALDGSVTWTSSNASVATVNSTGVVTAVANGTATITATTNDGTNISASCTVTVNIIIRVLATGVTLNQSAITLTTAGETATLTATVAPADVTDGSVTWTSSNTSVATVNSEGVVTAVANGTATITATTNDGTNIAASCAITVNISDPDTDISQIDNVVYMESTEVSAGSEETLSIKMKNTDGIQTLQFDLYLPDGVEVLTDEDDFELIELSTERTTARKMDQFSVQRMSNGAYRVLINSSRGYTFDGTDGEIATVQVGISETMTPGNYPVVFRDIVLVNTSSVGYETDYVKCSLNIPDYKPGDVNNDTKVNAIDLNAITNYILERRDFPFSFNKKAANINGDKETNGDEKINAIDLNAVTNMILNQGATTSGANRRRVILIPD